MAVERNMDGKKENIGWLRVDGAWIAGLWGLRATGRIRAMANGKFEIEVGHPNLMQGAVVDGHCKIGMAVMPTHVAPAGEPPAPDAEPPAPAALDT